jgi:hypothetical protein
MGKIYSKGDDFKLSYSGGEGHGNTKTLTIKQSGTTVTADEQSFIERFYGDLITIEFPKTEKAKADR